MPMLIGMCESMLSLFVKLLLEFDSLSLRFWQVFFKAPVSKEFIIFVFVTSISYISFSTGDWGKEYSASYGISMILSLYVRTYSAYTTVLHPLLHPKSIGLLVFSHKLIKSLANKSLRTIYFIYN